MIPTINIVAVIHLGFIAVFIGMYLAEAVLELNAFTNREDVQMHHAVIKLHYWIDLLVELPVCLGIILSGVAMAILVNTLTPWHWIKIGMVVSFILIAGACPINVIRRYRLLRLNASNEVLRRTSSVIIYTAAASMGLLFSGAFSAGLFLAYNRVIQSIYLR